MQVVVARPRLPCLMIATLAMPIGRLVGQRARSAGAADMLIVAVMSLPPPCLTIAALVMLIGRQAGLTARRHGAVFTSEKAAIQMLMILQAMVARAA